MEIPEPKVVAAEPAIEAAEVEEPEPVVEAAEVEEEAAPKVGGAGRAEGGWSVLTRDSSRGDQPSLLLLRT